MAVLGIIGAGQLARMTIQAAVGLPVDVRLFASGEDDAATAVTSDVTVGSIDSTDDLDRFAASCDVVTFDHELVAPERLRTLAERGHVLRPGPDAKLLAQDKLHQRRVLGGLGFPVPEWIGASTLDELTGFGQRHGWPIVAKSPTGGYDGRGVWVLDDPDAARELWDMIGGPGATLLVETHVDIQRELAVAVVRRPGGEHRAYAVTETVQQEGICVELLAPADVPAETAEAATAVATAVADAADAVGVVAVELFETPGGLVVNELALRPHNSAHWTIEGAVTSQFANHVRAVLDWPLGETTMTAPHVATVNVLGPADGSDPRSRIAETLALPGAQVHLYGKTAFPGRKLGHVTTLGTDRGITRERAHAAADRLTGQEVAA